MRKLKGIHFYVNIMNLNDIIKDEEGRAEINYSIHAVDTYFTRIETFAKILGATIEKITGSRLHMYVLGESPETYRTFVKIVVFANSLAQSFRTDDKFGYTELRRFQLQVGACLGQFYNFKFEREDADEETTIGFAANYAAKLQELCYEGELAISDSIYEILDFADRAAYTSCNAEGSIQKYGESRFHKAQIDRDIRVAFGYDEFMKATELHAKKVNSVNMTYREVRQKLNLDVLQGNEFKRLDGIPLFADIRGFTKQFDSDDANLQLMAEKTQKILTAMYSVVERNNGVHVQFQGDREFAIFHNYPNYNCCVDAVKAGLQLLDNISRFNVCIGIGQSRGEVLVTKIGAHGEKDFMLIGATVNEASINEDKHAGENQLVISREIYKELEQEKPGWTGIFQQVSTNDGSVLYYTTKGYQQLISTLELSRLRDANAKNSYNGAWGE